MHSWILTLITFIPLVGAVIIMFIPRDRTGGIKWTAVGVSVIPLVLATILWFAYDSSGVQFPKGAQFMVDVPWITQIGVRYMIGVDGVSMPMVWLTTLLVTLSLIYSLIIELRPKEYFFLFLVLETGMLGTFVALDFFLFYVFWELTLVPMYFLIGIWGGPRREYAAIKFFLYTLVGSVAMLLAILAMYFNTSPHTFNMMEMARAGMDARLGGVGAALVFWGLFLGFAIKVPVWPFHTWLPDAHVEAPTAGSVILAGVLLKMGTYGFLRVLLPILPRTSERFWFYMAMLALISIIYGALVAMAQKDLKKLIAYSSVNHMGYVILGIAAAASVTGANLADRAMALNGAMMQMFNHGVITGALFLLVGVIYERTHTRDLDSFGGLGARIPVFAGLFSMACFASLGLPGLSGFIGEFFVFRGAFGANILITALATIGIVVTAAYLLWTIQRVLLGPTNPKLEKLPDADAREVWSLAPLMALMLLFGVWPAPILKILNTASVEIARFFVG
ncbi:MAG: NADH-quinone oxidoreductase subunit M [Armatimonadetes bacterium]|nr:NADH-quinone oxidoreductase subunit M [Armatimonadota bacterium]